MLAKSNQQLGPILAGRSQMLSILTEKITEINCQLFFIFHSYSFSYSGSFPKTIVIVIVIVVRSRKTIVIVIVSVN